MWILYYKRWMKSKLKDGTLKGRIIAMIIFNGFWLLQCMWLPVVITELPSHNICLSRLPIGLKVFVFLFNVSSYPFIDSVQPLNVSSHTVIFFLSCLMVYRIRFWTLLYSLTLWSNRLNALITCLLSVYKPFIFSCLTEKH